MTDKNSSTSDRLLPGSAAHSVGMDRDREPFKHQTVSITVRQEGKTITVDREVAYNWPDYPVPSITQLIQDVANEAKSLVNRAERGNRIQKITEKVSAPFSDDFIDDEED